ncbi:MAG: hypothetical protein KAI70_01240 [Candidatus Omnitrophica bacterium]|nr:hypothetical protein [Candidatus Omnitrophota bacterium]
MSDTKITGKTISHGRQTYRTDMEGHWQVLMFGSHGPNDPPVGLSWKWRHIPADKVPNEVKKMAE